jgi:hypothetical protein
MVAVGVRLGTVERALARSSRPSARRDFLGHLSGIATGVRRFVDRW